MVGRLQFVPFCQGSGKFRSGQYQGLTLSAPGAGLCSPDSHESYLTLKAPLQPHLAQNGGFRMMFK